MINDTDPLDVHFGSWYILVHWFVAEELEVDDSVVRYSTKSISYM
jgi:hypothetical protein